MRYDLEEIKKHIYTSLKNRPNEIKKATFEYLYDYYTDMANRELLSKTIEGLDNATTILSALKEVMQELNINIESKAIENEPTNLY